MCAGIPQVCFSMFESRHCGPFSLARNVEQQIRAASHWGYRTVTPHKSNLQQHETLWCLFYVWAERTVRDNCSGVELKRFAVRQCYFFPLSTLVLRLCLNNVCWCLFGREELEICKAMYLNTVRVLFKPLNSERFVQTIILHDYNYD